MELIAAYLLNAWANLYITAMTTFPWVTVALAIYGFVSMILSYLTLKVFKVVR